MSEPIEQTPSSRLHLGHARADITPPTGIYHRMWGAARHHAATGVHRPLYADLLVLEPTSGESSQRLIRLQVDAVGLAAAQHEGMIDTIATACSVPRESVAFTNSHSHSAGVFYPDRIPLPGGDLIEPYLRDLQTAVTGLCKEAIRDLAEVVISYSRGRCDMASNRDLWDEERSIYVTGHNPEEPANDAVTAARVAVNGQTVLSVVHYACHPTTLAWENTLISPDYVGALRETVESATGAPCVFFQGVCGDLGPKDGFTGDPSIADRNGRQVGHAALSALMSLGPPETDFVYVEPIVSGATLGTWKRVPMDAPRRRVASQFASIACSVPLQLKPLSNPDELRRDLEHFSSQQVEEAARGDSEAARDFGARAERCRRWLGRMEQFPEGNTFPYRYSVWHLGDAVWIACGGEPYSVLQPELQRRFRDLLILVSPIAGDCSIAYLLPRDRYGKGLYQEEPSCLAPGCLEQLIDDMTRSICDLTGTEPPP